MRDGLAFPEARLATRVPLPPPHHPLVPRHPPLNQQELRVAHPDHASAGREPDQANAFLKVKRFFKKTTLRQPRWPPRRRPTGSGAVAPVQAPGTPAVTAAPAGGRGLPDGSTGGLPLDSLAAGGSPTLKCYWNCRVLDWRW